MLKAHSLFAKDVAKLDTKDKERLLIVLDNIKKNPTRYKSIKYISNGFRARIGNLRVVYMVKENEIWILIVEKRNSVYKNMNKRL